MRSTFKRVLQEEFPFLFAAPALLWQVYFLYLPLIILLSYSFLNTSAYGTLSLFTLVHYQELLTASHFRVLLNSCGLAALTSLVCLLIGYPIAHFLAFKAGRLKTLFLVFIILPSWTSFIVQVYAWFFLLKKEGFLSYLLYVLNFTNEPLHLLNTPFSLFIGMAYCYLPFMVFPLFAVLDRIDKTLIEASADLGANRYETFKKIIFPISLPGVMAGLTLVFVPAFGEFAIPDLLGGSKYAFIGSLVVDKFITFREWQSGGAVVLLGVMLPLIMMFVTGIVVQRLRTRYSEYKTENQKRSFLKDAKREFYG